MCWCWTPKDVTFQQRLVIRMMKILWHRQHCCCQCCLCPTIFVVHIISFFASSSAGWRRLWEGKMSQVRFRTRFLPSCSTASRIQSLQRACTLVDVFSVVGQVKRCKLGCKKRLVEYCHPRLHWIWQCRAIRTNAADLYNCYIEHPDDTEHNHQKLLSNNVDLACCSMLTVLQQWTQSSSHSSQQRC